MLYYTRLLVILEWEKAQARAGREDGEGPARAWRDGHARPPARANRGAGVPDRREGSVLVVRLWREPGTFATPDEAWRGRVEHVASGEHRHFVGLSHLVREIMALIGDPPVEPSSQEGART